jgi:hypothetical protein
LIRVKLEIKPRLPEPTPWVAPVPPRLDHRVRRPELNLSSRAGRAVSWLLLFGTWANWGATTASAVLGTSKGTPIAGAGFHAGALAENGVYGLLVLVGLTMTVSCIGLVVGAWRAR